MIDVKNMFIIVMVKYVKKMVKAMRKKPTQTLLMISIFFVFILMIFEVIRYDPKVEKLDFLKNLFGMGEETNSSSSSSTVTCTGNKVLDNGGCKTLTQYCDDRNGTPNTTTFIIDDPTTWCVLNSTGSGSSTNSTGSGSSTNSTGSGSSTNSTGSGSSTNSTAAPSEIVIKMDGAIDYEELIDWDQIILRDINESVVEYDVTVNTVFAFHGDTDPNYLTSFYPNNPLHIPRPQALNTRGRVIWNGSPNTNKPNIGDTLLTLFPTKTVASMELITSKRTSQRHVALKVAYDGGIYNIPKSQFMTTFES